MQQNQVPTILFVSSPVVFFTFQKWVAAK